MKVYAKKLNPHIYSVFSRIVSYEFIVYAYLLMLQLQAQ